MLLVAAVMPTVAEPLDVTPVKVEVLPICIIAIAARSTVKPVEPLVVKVISISDIFKFQNSIGKIPTQYLSPTLRGFITSQGQTLN